MKSRPIAFTVSVVLIASVGLTSTVSAEQLRGRPMAEGRGVVSPPIVPRGFSGRPHVSHPVVASPFRRPLVPHGFAQHRVVPHRFAHHRFGSFGVIGGPAVAFAATTVYAAPTIPYAAGGYYDNGSGYYNSPAVYTPQVAGPAVVEAAPAPMPNVIQYSTGRYEMRGDGLTIPYTWVWIPNPPPGPPAAAPTGAIVPGDSSSSRGQVYRWTDGQGVLHMTDRWESVPPQYRPQAKQNLPS